MRQPPEKSTGREVVETVVEAGIGMVPVAGSPLAAAFAVAVGWAYNRRVQEWFGDVADALTELQEQVDDLDMEALGDRDDFVDVVVNATRAAAATSARAKLDALRNAVLNTAITAVPDADLQAIFVRYVDEFTPSHLRLLTFLNDPGQAFDEIDLPRPDLMMGGRSHLLEQARPEFAARRDLYDPLAADLVRAGLMDGMLHGTMTGQGLWQPATSARGRQFLAFIADPRRPSQ